MAPTTSRLFLWLGIAAALAISSVVLSRVPRLKPYNPEGLLPFFAGVIASVALTSWSYNPGERENIRALSAFWQPFTVDCYLVLPSSEPSGARQDGMIERSPFTPYHDAVAASEVLTFLHDRFGATVRVISSKEIEDLAAMSDHNLIVIGGPNFNHITAEFMHELWAKAGESSFQWSSEFSASTEIKPILRRTEDHLVRLSSNPPTLIEEVFDVRPEGSPSPLIARGLCVRAEGILRGGKCVLIIAGVDSAFGTLAGARTLKDPRELKKIGMEAVLQVVVSARVDGYDIGKVTTDRLLGFSMTPQSVWESSPVSARPDPERNI